MDLSGGTHERAVCFNGTSITENLELGTIVCITNDADTGCDCSVCVSGQCTQKNLHRNWKQMGSIYCVVIVTCEEESTQAASIYNYNCYCITFIVVDMRLGSACLTVWFMSKS